MITKERKEEIIATIEYAINRHINKQSLVYYTLEDLLSGEEREWYEETCDGRYEVSCCDFDKAN